MSTGLAAQGGPSIQAMLRRSAQAESMWAATRSAARSLDLAPGRMMFAMNAPGRDAARTVIAADGTRYRRPGRLAEVVVNDLARQIVGGQHAENDVLPNEPALCDQFGMSRTVVREALKMLEERGLVRVEQGRGTTVQPRNSWNLLDPVILGIALQYDDDMSLLDDLISVRRVLEQEMTRAATSRLTEDELGGRWPRTSSRWKPRATTTSASARSTSDSTRHHGSVGEPRGPHDRPSDPPLRRCSGRNFRRRCDPRLPRAHDRRASRDLRGACVARDGDLAGELTAAHIESAWAERKFRIERRTLTSGDHSYDDCRRCVSQSRCRLGGSPRRHAAVRLAEGAEGICRRATVILRCAPPQRQLVAGLTRGAVKE